ncbi:3-oxoacyl-[acyl-carrier-protein] reductase [Bartonella sp. DGB2]|uniref:3-oxoacyl-[acyl-carrier-protein] reductase n=1 Tax=Bartonella sp. DGB2 TaxID=3388426 RepID=UPI00398FF767
MFDLTGRKALITGATGGIGEAIARTFHARGAVIGLHGTREEKLQELAASLGERCFTFPADLSDRSAVKVLAENAEKEMGGVDILINNAGITRDGLFIRMSDKDWDDVISVNLTAVFALTRGLMAFMMKRRFGRVINIGSVVGTVGNPGQVNYCAVKAGLVGFSKSLAQEVASRNITVNSIAPGFIESAMTDKLNEKQKEQILASIPMKRMGTGSDVAAAALYLASDVASYMTGQTLHVNGGMAMI